MFSEIYRCRWEKWKGYGTHLRPATMLSLTVFGYSVMVMLSLMFLRRVLARNMSMESPPLPPGPPSDPIIGHLRMIPSQRQPNAFYEWSKVYGEVLPSSTL